MSLSRSISITGSQSSQIRRSRVGLVALWGLQVVVAGLFLLAGGSKLAGAAAMVALFDAIGVGQWFRYVTGFIEVTGAVALLVPALAPFGALLLALTMVGAITTHLFIVGGSPVVPVFLLLGSLAILWARRDQLSGALSRLRRVRV
ncbi:MAG TPA: DoxX family protein [Actinomycetota bacterium]|nr:DoxX family protein [Actinomycetota bacterium]